MAENKKTEGLNLQPQALEAEEAVLGSGGLRAKCVGCVPCRLPPGSEECRGEAGPAEEAVLGSGGLRAKRVGCVP